MGRMCTWLARIKKIKKEPLREGEVKEGERGTQRAGEEVFLAIGRGDVCAERTET